MQGWISLHRKICDNWVWKDKPFSYGQAWMDILLECNHEERKTVIKGLLLTVNRGESVNSLKTWAKRFGWSISKVRHFLILLEKDSMCDMVNERVTTRLIVCNYSSYQNRQHTEGTQKNRRRIAEESQKDPNNNVNNENNDNNKDCYELSKLLFSLIKERNPNHKEPNFDKWSEHISLMIRVDKRSSREIEGAIRWSQQDSFWQNNILSTSKLREQFDKLYLKAKGEKDNGTSGRSVTESQARELAESIANDTRLK